MEQIIITKASLSDVAIIQAIGRETFIEAFSYANSDADMKKYLDESFGDEKINAEFNDRNSSFFIAWNIEDPVGYLKLNTGNAQTDLKDQAAIEIERIYVRAAYHGKKVGQLLYEKAVEIAQAEKKSYIWLGVWEENLRAINFYKKNGFIAFDTHSFMLGNDEQTDVMMKKIVD